MGVPSSLLIRSPRAALLGIALMAFPLIVFGANPLLLLLLPLLPVALCTLGAVSGLVPMGISLAVWLGVMGYQLGSPGLIASAILLVPPVLAFALLFIRQVPFKKSLLLMMGVHLLSLVGIYLLLQFMTGWDLYHAAGEFFMQAAGEAPVGDLLLYQLYTMGMLGLPKGMGENILVMTHGLLELLPAAREELLLSARLLGQNLAFVLVPSLIASLTVLSGAGCLLSPLYFGYIAQERREFQHPSLSPDDDDDEDEDEDVPFIEAEDIRPRRKVDFPDLGMPPFSQWHLPRGMGWKVITALVLAALLRSGRTPAMQMAALFLDAGASALLLLQGLALISFMQKVRGTRRGWRIALPMVLFALFFLHPLLTTAGVLDQITNIRRLRKPRPPKEDSAQ